MRSEEDIIEWRTVTDLHKDYWETVGGDAANFYEALNEKAAVLYSYRGGRLIAATVPSDKKVFF